MNSTDKNKQILRDRARAIAQKPVVQEKGEVITVLEFVLSYETYAIETMYIREVVPLREIIPLPGLPDFVLGLINIRGEILSILDIKKFFQLPGQQLSDLNKVIILTNGRLTFGVLADRVNGIKEVEMNDIFNTVINFRDKRDEYLHGITSSRIILLDGKKLFNEKKIIIHQD